MPQIQPIVIDGVTFTPTGRNGNVVTYKRLDENIPALRSVLTISLSEPSKTSRLYKARVRLTIPEGELDSNGVHTGKVLRTQSHDIISIYDASSLMEERDATVDNLTSLVGTTVFEDVFQKLQPLY